MVSGPTEIGKSPPFDIPAMYVFFVRIGSMAEICTAKSQMPLERGRRVIVRSSRGIELAEVAGPSQNNDPSDDPVRIIRPTTHEDELLIRRLERHKREAVEACRTALAESGSSTTLLDVDQLFDGGTLIMHFLGPVDAIAKTVTKEIADQYESIVRSRHFSKLLRDGCGPDCGTAQGGGCGSSCAGCSVACKTH